MIRFVLNNLLFAWCLTFAVCVVIAGIAVWINTALERRSRRQDDLREQQLARILKAAEPRPWSSPAAKGFQQRKGL